MNRLRMLLQDTEPGPIADASSLEGLLAGCWEQFTGGEAQGMKGDKLLGRMTDVTWKPPMLSFVIERHGGTVLGSSRAELHRWEVNVESRDAVCLPGRFRQLKPTQPRLNVLPLAEELCGLIRRRQDNPRLVWSQGRQIVSVRIRVVIPDQGPKQTVAERRRRFTNVLRERLEAIGWVRAEGKAHHTFRPKA
jgi:hypothetical protein